MVTIGLTGGIASGKSTVSLLLKEKGAVIIDADVIAKDILKPGRPAMVKVVEHFGNTILKADGNINRQKLASIVFSSKKQLETLNRITHPYIIDEIKRQLSFFKQEGTAVIILDAALLLELGLETLVDEVWVVAVEQQTQIKRLIDREKNISYDEAIQRIKAQMSLDHKKQYADKVIDNNGTIENTKIQLDKIWGETMQRCLKNLQ